VKEGKLISEQELMKMDRAWKIKNKALAQDKADLAKYNLDPQSYH